MGELLSMHPNIGTELGNNLFKIRIAIKSKGKGKSGGARVITYILVEQREVFLLAIYDKSEYGSIDEKILKQIIKTLD